MFLYTSQIYLCRHKRYYTLVHNLRLSWVEYVEVKYDTIQDAILTCARELTWVSLIYHTEPAIKKVQQKK